MSESKQVVGKLISITEKSSGWTSIEVDVPNMKYPVRLDTKREEIIEQARALSSSVATWTYTETESENLNPKSGKPYLNRYLDSVEAGGTAQETGESKAEVDWDAKERRDFRSRSWAHTISAFQHTIKVDEDPRDVFERLRIFHDLLYEDICGRSFAYPDYQDVPF